MRLSDDTADVPDRLIALQEKGEVVFLCGAGISQRYGLPSFHKLTTNIYADLGESWEGYPAEEDAMGFDQHGVKRGPAALDRALFALAKRLRGTDTASRIRAEALLTKTIEDNLQSPVGPFPAHQDVWTLSRDPQMRPRIVTTNFDTLFERASAEDVTSRACADLPPPLGTDFTGVLHLHGRIADTDLGLSRTSLVLNSAEFGEAYLRSGWAARYVYDLARATTIVILGYGADDPPMRYILEVLTADRERYPDIREIFAFVPSKPDELSRDRISAIWEAKGVTAVTYDSRDPKDHDTLYLTISKWSVFAADPTGWRRGQATRILCQEPDEVSAGDWQRLRWLLSGGDAGELLGDINPDPKWAAPLAKAEVFRSTSISPFRWILARLNDHNMPAAAAENLPLSPDTLGAIERVLGWQNRKSVELHPVLLRAWQLIVRVAARRFSSKGDGGLKWFRAKAAIKEGDFSLTTKRDVLSCLRPQIRIGHVFRWQGLEDEPTPDTLALRHVLRIDWGQAPLDKIGELIAQWPPQQRPSLIRSLLRELDDALEEAADTATLYTASSDVKSVSRHPQDQHPDGFYSIVRAIIDLWDADSAVRPEGSKAQAAEWLASPYLLLRRMGLHALKQPFFSSNEVADHLLALSNEDFWLSDARRETMQLFVHRWPNMGVEDRAKVEHRICDGLPRELLIPDGDPNQIAAVRENAVFIRLARIEDAGGNLTPLAADAMGALRERHPGWKSNGEQDDFRVWSSGVRTMGRQGDLALLADTPPEKMLERVEEVVGRNPFAQGDLWGLYCDAEPQNALSALLVDDPTSANRSGAWQSFFWSITATEKNEIHQVALEAITSEEFEFAPFTAIADWLLRKRNTLTISTPDFLALWDRLFSAVKAHSGPIEDQSRRDVVFSMLNSAEGKIGTVLLDEYERVRGSDGKNNQLAILFRLEQLVSAEGELGFLGTAAAMDGLRDLFNEHEAWAKERLLPLTNWSSPFAPAAWSVLLRGQIPKPALFAVLKGALLEAGSHAELDRSIDAVAQWMVAPLLWAQAPNGPVPDISGVEVRRALVRSVEEVRSSAAYWLLSAIEKMEGRAGDIWRDRIGPLFKQVWPLGPASRSKGASLHLIRLALHADDAFADAAETIAPALGPLDTWEIESYLGRDEDAKAFYETAPAALLTLLDAVVVEDCVPNSLLSMLQRLVDNDATLGRDPRYLKLMGWARRHAAA